MNRAVFSRTGEPVVSFVNRPGLIPRCSFAVQRGTMDAWPIQAGGACAPAIGGPAWLLLRN
jgi:hypothetical protein